MNQDDQARFNQIADKLAAAEKRLAELQGVADAQTAKDFAKPLEFTLNPTEGKTGQKVTITGKDFGKEQGTSYLIFEGRPMKADAWSDTSIVVTVPGSVKSGDVVVAVGNRKGSAPFTVL